MKTIYNLQYERLIDRINEGNSIVGTIYLKPDEYKAISENLLIVRYLSDSYYVVDLEYDSISKKSKATLLKL